MLHTTNIVVLVGPPSITFIDHHKVSVEGDKSSLICVVANDDDSDKSLEVKWYNSSGTQVLSDNSRIIVHNMILTETGQVKSLILFDPVNHTDSGVYTCKAFNHRESSTKANANLTVKCKSSHSYCMFTSKIFIVRFMAIYALRLIVKCCG